MKLESSVTLFDDNKVESKFAQLQVTADGIASEVSRKVGNDEVISRINQSAESITIQANKINIDGVITAINNNGTTTINGGKITTGTLGANAINANSGKFNSANIPDLSATKITTDTLDTARLNISGVITAINNNGTTTIDGDKITAGSISANRIKVAELVTIGPSTSAHGKITSNGFDVYGNNGANVIASFGATATIGRTDRQRVVINPSGIDMYGYNASASTPNQNLCHIGFDTGNAASGQAIAPFYTFGTRLTGTGKGNYSVVEGYNGEASGFGSYAGTHGTAVGNGSFARGFKAQANGMYQTVIGVCNEISGTKDAYSSGDKAFIIGGGNVITGDRKNAFDVQWNGWVYASGGYTGLYKITTVKKTLSSGIDAHSNVAGTSISMTEQAGYEAVGIVGWSTSNWKVRPTTHYVSSNTSIFAGFSNDTNQDANEAEITFRVLWLKATSG